MAATVQKFPLGGLKLLKMLWFSVLHQATLPGRLTASRTTELHWQLAVMPRGSQAQMIFQSSPCAIRN